MTPVSATHPSTEEGAVLDMCHAYDIGLEHVARMGLVPHARDVPKYVGLLGVEPEIQTEHPAWVISFQGAVSLPLMPRPAAVYPKEWDDVTCVVVDGVPSFFATGRVVYDNGAVKTPIPPSEPPSLSLPPLAP